MNIDLLATTIALLTFFGISSLMALSLNLEYGVAGIPNSGQVLFVSVGAYIAGMSYTRLLPLLAGADFRIVAGLLTLFLTISGGVGFFFMPNTSGKSLEQIEAERA